MEKRKNEKGKENRYCVRGDSDGCFYVSLVFKFGGETKRDITKISVIGIKRKNSQVEDFKRGIEEAANAKRVDVEYLEIEEDYDTIKEYIDREIKNGSQALIVFSEKEEQILSYLQSEKKKIPLILVNPGGTEEKTIRVWFDVQDMAECLAEKIRPEIKLSPYVLHLICHLKIPSSF